VQVVHRSVAMHDTQNDLAALAWLQRIDPGIEQRPIVVVHETAPTAVLPDFVIRFAEQLFRLPADPVDLEGTVLAAPAGIDEVAGH
jgi:hypothetical protein